MRSRFRILLAVVLLRQPVVILAHPLRIAVHRFRMAIVIRRLFAVLDIIAALCHQVVNEMVSIQMMNLGSHTLAV